MRPDVAREAVWLARQLAALAPTEPEVFALTALMEFQSSRFASRTDAEGLPVTLPEQDRSHWDRSAIERGRAALQKASAFDRGLGYYGLQLHTEIYAIAPTADDTDWPRILALYDGLLALAPSSVIRLNRAVAVSMIDGPEAALRIVEPLESELSGFRPFHGVRGELLERVGQRDAAVAAFRRPPIFPATAPRRRCCGGERSSSGGRGRERDQTEPYPVSPISARIRLRS